MAKINITRRRLIRLALVVVWIGLGIVLFVLNRGHTLLVDNRNVESPALRAPDLITVTVDKGKSLEFFRGDRDLFEVGGGEHRLLVEFSDGAPPFETRFRLPLKPDMFLVSIPKLLHGVEPAIKVFHTQPEPRTDDVEAEAVEDEIGAEL